MVRGFDIEEKLKIRQALIDNGRNLFTQFGFQKTSIREITKKTGIAPGTFYRFFESKEALYFEILEQEEEKLREIFVDENIFEERAPKQRMKDILQHILQAVEQNPFIQELYASDTMNTLVRNIPGEHFKEHTSGDAAFVRLIIGKLEEEGWTIEKKPEVIAGLFRSVFLLTLHKKEIGEKVYAEVIATFIDLIVDRIIQKEEK